MSVNKDIIIALDEGTTNAKAVAFDGSGTIVARFSRALEIQTRVRDGWSNPQSCCLQRRLTSSLVPSGPLAQNAWRR
jgi:sugar (pentulose or hexulose) kinase